jgi:hypothetical protein
MRWVLETSTTRLKGIAKSCFLPMMYAEKGSKTPSKGKKKKKKTATNAMLLHMNLALHV